MKIDSAMKELLFTTVYVEAYSGNDKSTGTGFLYDAIGDRQPGYALPVLITNKHVIRGADRVVLRFVLAGEEGPQWGKGVAVEIEEPNVSFVGHPDQNVDVTAMLINPVFDGLGKIQADPFYRMISSSLIPDEEKLDELDASVPVTFIGYPSGLYDTKNLTPIIRKGFTATPIHLDWKGEPSFLIDASVFPGSSGSPVFMAEFGTYSTRQGLNVGSRVHFLGIVAAVHQQPSLAAIVASGSPQIQFNQMIDLGIVYNWRAVEETINAACRAGNVDRNAPLPPRVSGDVQAQEVEGQSGLDKVPSSHQSAEE